MTFLAAGIDVAGNTPNIRPGGSDFTATSKTDGFKRIAGILRDALRGRTRLGVFRFLHDRGFDVPVADPRQSRDFAGTGGRQAGRW